MAGYRRSRRAGTGITQREAHFRRAKNALNERLRVTADPERRVQLCADYVKAALRQAKARGYPLDTGPDARVLEQVLQALITAGDGLLRPGHRKEG